MPVHLICLFTLTHLIHRLLKAVVTMILLKLNYSDMRYKVLNITKTIDEKFFCNIIKIIGSIHKIIVT